MHSVGNSFSFPPHELADDDGLLAVGGHLDSQILIDAYRQGIFPWPLGEGVITWFSPPKRAILFLDDLRIPRSLKKVLKQGKFRNTVNQATSLVIDNCASAPNRLDSHGRPQRGTWITEDMKRAYKQLAMEGYVHSIESWEGSDLVGGLYGVSIGKMFAGESMFYTQPNASKIALMRLIEILKLNGATWIDCQVMTPLFKSFGATEIDRSYFLELLQEALSVNCKMFI